MIDITPALANIASALARYRLTALGSQECRIVMYSLARKKPLAGLDLSGRHQTPSQINL